MKVTIKKLFFVIVSLIIVSTGIIAYTSTTSIDISIAVDKTVKAIDIGKYVEVTFKVKKNNIASDGFNVFVGTISYDENRFEKLTESDFTELGGFSDLIYNEDTKQFSIIRKEPLTSEGEVFSVNLKAKTDAASGYSNIEFKDIQTSNGEDTIGFEAISSRLEIISDKAGNGSDLSNQDYINEANGFAIGKVSLIAKMLPKLVIAYTLIAVIALGIIVLSNKEKRKYIVAALVVFVLVLIVSSTYTLAMKYTDGELNGDGVTNDIDVNLMQKHLIAYDVLTDAGIKEADVNKDGKIDATDLSLIIKDYFKDIDYDVNIDKIEVVDGSNDKDKDLELEISVTSSNDGNVREFVINDEIYEAKEKSKGIYSVKLPPAKKNGEIKISINDIIMDNGSSANIVHKEGNPVISNPNDIVGEVSDDKEGVITDNKEEVITDDTEITIDILKKTPSIVKYKESLTDGSNAIDVSFELKDDDKAITGEARYQVVDTDGNILLEGVLTKGENSISFTPPNDEDTYILHITVAYKLTDKDMTIEELRDKGLAGEIMFEENLKAGQIEILNPESAKDPDEKPVEISIKNMRVSNPYPEKNKDVVVTFEASHNQGDSISKIIANSTIIIPTKNTDNTYSFTVNSFDKAGNYSIDLTEVTFESGVSANLQERATMFVQKSNPVVSNFTVDENVEKLLINGMVDIYDDDKAFTSAKAVLVTNDNPDEVVKEIDLSLGENQLDLNVQKDTDYTLKILVSYNKADESTDDYVVKDELIKEIPLYLWGDYKLEINDIKTFSDKYTTEAKNFEKNKDVYLSFKSTNATPYSLQSAIINGVTYSIVNEANTYKVKLAGFEASGNKDIIISEVKLENGKILTLENKKANINVLKDIPSASDITYIENEDGSLELSFRITDKENALKNAKLVATSGSESQEKDIDLQSEFVTITISKGKSDLYDLKIVGNVQRADDNSVNLDNYNLKEQFIDLSAHKYELKDITAKNLYVYEGNEYRIVKNASISEINNNIDNYFIKIDMKDQKSISAPIVNVANDNGILALTLDLTEYIQYRNGTKSTTIVENLGSVSGDIVTIENVDDFVARVNKNPSGTYELTQDLDMSKLTLTGTTVFTGNFTGTINGNGHTISNLTKPLFSNLNGGVVKNLVIENASARLNQNGGFIAMESNNKAKIENVHLNNITIITGGNQIGSLIGLAKNTSISDVSVRNLTMSGGHLTYGGIVGWGTNTTVKDAYVTGSITCTNTGEGRVGGIVGVAENMTIENIVSDIKLTTKNYVGGIIGLPYGTKSTVKNVMILDTTNEAENNYAVISELKTNTGTKTDNLIENAYIIEGSKAKPQQLNNNAKVNSIAKEKINKDFYTNTLHLDDSWNLDNIDQNGMPSLNGADPINSTTARTKVSGIYIPNLDRLQKIGIYNENMEIAYANMYKLMPHFDANVLVSEGNKLEVNSSLNTKIIKVVLPIAADGTMVDALSYKNINSLTSIKVVFEDGSIEEYKVSSLGSQGFVANYIVEKLGVRYNYPKYIVNTETQAFKTLLSKAQGFTYNDIDASTPEEDSRIQKDFYNDFTKNNLEEALINIIGNSEEQNIYIDDNVMNNKVLTELTEDHMLEKLLWTYNYFTRWYGFDVEGVDAYSFAFFDSGLYNGIDSFDITREIMSLSNGNTLRNTNSTANLYQSILSNKTLKTGIDTFVEDIVEVLSNETNATDWFTNNFPGFIYEEGLTLHKDAGVRYRAWDHLKYGKTGFILPLLTLPEDSGYIVSFPTQIAVGTTRLYSSNPETEEGKAVVMELMKNFGHKWATIYDTFYDIYNDSELKKNTATQKYNSILVFNLDTRSLSSKFGGAQEAATTEEPFHKNFNLAVGKWCALNGSAAYANGSETYWVAYQQLSPGGFYTSTHETAHNQDGRLWLFDTGRRTNGWAEDYADAGFAQTNGNGTVVSNWYAYNPIDTDVTTNTTPDRVNTLDKINSYLKGMWEALEYLDYAEAQALLSMSKEDQEKLTMQVNYKETADQSKGGSITQWTKVTTLDKKLETMDDLIDNRITLSKGYSNGSTIVTNGYGEDSIYTRTWYQPHADTSRPDTHAFAKLAWRMGGHYGYEKGLVAYFGNGKYHNDLDALRGITNNPNYTYDQWMKDIYNSVAANKDKVEGYNFNEIVELYKEALTADAQANDRSVTRASNLRAMLYQNLKKTTDDFTTSIYKGNDGSVAEKIHITSGIQLMEQIAKKPNGHFILDKDIDMTGTVEYTATAFVGNLDGNGHKITNLTHPLFSNMKYSQIKNLIIESPNIQITDNGYAGAISRQASYSRIDNVHVKDANISGTTFVGAIVGYASESIYADQISVSGNITGTSNYVGALFGAFNGSFLENSYSRSVVSGATNTGGIAGYAKDSRIDSTYTVGSVTTSRANTSGGIVGVVNPASNTVNRASITNNLSLANTVNAYKFDGQSAASVWEKSFSNNYEYNVSSGSSTLTKAGIDFTGKLTTISDDKIKDAHFYKDSLKWDENLWDTSKVAEGGLPKLKGIDPHPYESDMLSTKKKITTREEFLKIKENPTAYYVLEGDIDFTNYAEPGDAVITGIFQGTLDGNGNTIKGLTNKALFNTLSGTVTNLNIINSTNTQNNKVDIGILANVSNAADIVNVKFDNIRIVGKQVVGVVVGRDQSDSKFERISITNSTVNSAGTGYYAGALVGRKYGGIVKDVYVQANVEGGGTDSGGLIGATHNTMTIENVIVDSNFTRTKNSDNRLSNTAFIGNMANTTSVKNVVVYGDIINSYNDQVLGKVIANGVAVNVINQAFTNVFEVSGSQGKSNATTETKGHLDVATEEQLKSEDFFVNQLGFSREYWNFSNKEGNNIIPKLK